MSLSVAIPFFNTSEYFLETIRTPLSSNLVTEIIISDDNSSQDEHSKLVELIKNLGPNNNKIKVYKNTENRGAFINKFTAVSYCTNKWVYLLDSDNFVHENMLEKFFKEDLNENVCYMPHKYNFCSYIFELKQGFGLLDKNKIKEAINNNTIGHFINLCNFIVSKNRFLEVMKEGLQKNDVIDVFPVADCAAMTYLWLKNGGDFKIIQDFQYFHRVREDGYYESNKKDAENCVSHYSNKILHL